MAAAKLALGRVQTGSFRGDQMQKQARAVSLKANSLETRATDLETRATALEARATILERTTGSGFIPVAMGNAAYTLTAAQAAGRVIQLTGAHTAARALTFPSATNATAYERWVSNATSGGFAINVTTTAGSVAVAAGATKLILFWGSAPVVLV